MTKQLEERSILILHNEYQQAGGEDVVVRAESQLLRRRGYRVHVETVSNHQINSLASKAHTFVNIGYSRSSAALVRSLIAEHSAKIVHIHNFFPRLSPSIHMEARRSGAAVVQTLHNYRLMCANAQFLRDGKVCEKCMGGNRHWGILHRCYKDSTVGSAGVVRMQTATVGSPRWIDSVDQFIALTQFAKSRFVEGGVPPEKISVKPNFVKAPDLVGRTLGSGAIFVGRLSVEKGVDTLIEAWRSMPDIPLTIVGDGPERTRLESIAPSGVSFVGQVNSEKVRELMLGASFAVVPSIWYEGFPMTIVEAFAAGLPVIASRIGSLEEVIEHGENGYLFRPADPADLKETVRMLISSPERVMDMQTSAIDCYRRLYTEEVNYDLLIGIYERALAFQASGVGGSPRSWQFP